MITQEKLGERAGVSGKLVGQIERGGGNPTLDVIAGLAAGLEVGSKDLLDFEEERPHGPATGAADAFAAGEQIRRYLAGRSAEELSRALRILEAAFNAPADAK
jgi:transcriptional regulator with XRE-family HTH domain